MAQYCSMRRDSPSPRRARTTTAAPIQIVFTPGSGSGRAKATAFRLRTALARRWPTRIEGFRSLESLHRWANAGRDRFSLVPR
jgi:hypothetical protein